MNKVSLLLLTFHFKAKEISTYLLFSFLEIYKWIFFCLLLDDFFVFNSQEYRLLLSTSNTRDKGMGSICKAGLGLKGRWSTIHAREGKMEQKIGQKDEILHSGHGFTQTS